MDITVGIEGDGGNIPCHQVDTALFSPRTHAGGVGGREKGWVGGGECPLEHGKEPASHPSDPPTPPTQQARLAPTSSFSLMSFSPLLLLLPPLPPSTLLSDTLVAEFLPSVSFYSASFSPCLPSVNSALFTEPQTLLQVQRR